MAPSKFSENDGRLMKRPFRHCLRRRANRQKRSQSAIATVVQLFFIRPSAARRWIEIESSERASWALRSDTPTRLTIGPAAEKWGSGALERAVLAQLGACDGITPDQAVFAPGRTFGYRRGTTCANAPKPRLGIVMVELP
jgi:hypothetical protein